MNLLPSRGYTWNSKSYFLWKTMKKYLWMSSAAVVIGAWRVKLPMFKWVYLNFQFFLPRQLISSSTTQCCWQTNIEGMSGCAKGDLKLGIYEDYWTFWARIYSFLTINLKKIRECPVTLRSLSKCKSNLISDSVFLDRNPFCPISNGSRYFAVLTAGEQLDTHP